MIRRSKNGKIPRTANKALTLRDLASIFYLYLICVGLSFVVFLIELFSDRILKRVFKGNAFILQEKIRGCNEV